MGAFKYDAKAADMWSAGVVLFALLAGRLPFDPDDPKFATAVVSATYEFPTDVSVSNECRHLVSRLLDPDPNTRAASEEVMRHPWFLQDLAPGALQLNDTLLRWQKRTAQRDAAVAAAVDALVDRAAEIGGPGEPVTCVQL